LIDEVRILPEEGEYRLELRGELGAILALAGGPRMLGDQQRKKHCKSRWLRGPATINVVRVFASQLELVARLAERLSS
jgi:hypothetical protein